MKGKVLLFTLLAPFLSAAQGHAFEIDGHIGALVAPATVYLTYHVGKERFSDSAKVTRGRFQFKGSIAYPVQAVLRLNPAGDGREKAGDLKFFYLEGGHISVVSGNDSLSGASITGTRTNEENLEFERLTGPIDSRYQLILARKKKTGEGQAGSAAFDRETDSLAAACTHDMQAAIVSFIRSHPGSAISIIQLRSFTFDLDHKELQSLYDQLTDTLRQSPDGKAYAQRLADMLLLPPGSAAPLFAAKDTSGQTVNLASFRGQYVLLDFWASWCTPCRQENPNIARAYLQYKDKNFTVISISLDENRRNWTAAIRRDKLSWPQLSGLDGFQGKPAQLYHITVLPQNILIDPNGRIVAKNIFGNDLQNRLKETFP